MKKIEKILKMLLIDCRIIGFFYSHSLVVYFECKNKIKNKDKLLPNKFELVLPADFNMFKIFNNKIKDNYSVYSLTEIILSKSYIVSISLESDKFVITFSNKMKFQIYYLNEYKEDWYINDIQDINYVYNFPEWSFYCYYNGKLYLKTPFDKGIYE